MLHYLEFGLSHIEVPDEVALCIYISGCPNRCADCHYPEMQMAKSGELLSEYFESMLDLYHEYVTCVCFLGEGDCSDMSKCELLRYLQISHNRGYKCCLYSGRDVMIENWMRSFDYLKLGSYNKNYGPLTSKTTNQKMLKNMNGVFVDITSRFWSEGY